MPVSGNPSRGKPSWLGATQRRFSTEPNGVYSAWTLQARRTRKVLELIRTGTLTRCSMNPTMREELNNPPLEAMCVSAFPSANTVMLKIMRTVSVQKSPRATHPRCKELGTNMETLTLKREDRNGLVKSPSVAGRAPVCGSIYGRTTRTTCHTLH